MKKHIEYLLAGIIILFGGFMIGCCIWFYTADYPTILTIIAAIATFVFAYFLGRDYMKKHS